MRPLGRKAISRTNGEAGEGSSHQPNLQPALENHDEMRSFYSNQTFFTRANRSYALHVREDNPYPPNSHPKELLGEVCRDPC